jgi:hypothetical protein
MAGLLLLIRTKLFFWRTPEPLLLLVGLGIASGGKSVVWMGSGGQTSERRANPMIRLGSAGSTEWSDQIEVLAWKEACAENQRSGDAQRTY